MKEKKKLGSLDKYVIFSVVSLIIFTIVMIVVFLKIGMIPDTLVTCFFSCFGGEVLSCALIKVFKLRKNDEEGEG